MPVGIDLGRRIAKLVDFKSANSEGPNQGDGDLRFLGQFHQRFGHSVEAYRRAGWAIRDGVRFTNSIDDFLDMHKDDPVLQCIGKAAIVQTILTAESNTSLSFNPYGLNETLNNIDKTWYMRFFRMLTREVKRANASQIFETVAFIDFNYDRCLQHFLIHALALAYNLPIDDAASIVSDLHIIHPYGTVGELPYFTTDNPIPFGPIKPQMREAYDYIKLSEEIKTYTEQITTGEMLPQIHDEMFRAERIVFLGFAYHNQNIRMLTPGQKIPLKPVLGTAYQMSDSDVEVIRGQLAQIFAGSLQGTIPAMQIGNRKSADLFEYYTKTLTD